MHVVGIVVGPCVLDDLGRAQLEHLFLDIAFHETAMSQFRVFDGFEFDSISAVDVLDACQPPIDQPVVMSVHGGVDSPTPIVTTHDDMFDAEHFDGVLEHRHEVHVGGNHEIGNVSVHEEIARLRTGYLIGVDSTVGASDEQEFRLLTGRQAIEKARVAGATLIHPGPVLVEQILVGAAMRHIATVIVERPLLGSMLFSLPR